jgi:dihydrofolate reductase
MTARVRVHNLAISLDGYGTGEGQSLSAPFGHADGRLMEWFKGTRTFQAMIGDPGAGRAGIDEAFAGQWGSGIGAEIMGRKKFTPATGPWDTEDDWRGWWGEEPPFHTPVFVWTHFPRSPMVVGETTFHFVDGTPAEVLEQALAAADGLDVRIGGGPTTVRQFLAADLVDLMHVALVPILLGRGVRLWDGLEGLEERFDVETVVSPSGVTHLTFNRKSRG